MLVVVRPNPVNSVSCSAQLQEWVSRVPKTTEGRDRGKVCMVEMAAKQRWEPERRWAVGMYVLLLSRECAAGWLRMNGEAARCRRRVESVPAADE